MLMLVVRSSSVSVRSAQFARDESASTRTDLQQEYQVRTIRASEERPFEASTASQPVRSHRQGTHAS